MFVIARLFSSFMLPPGIFIMLLLVSLIFLIKKKYKIGIIFIIIITFFIYIFSITPTKKILMKPLEFCYTFPDIEKTEIDSIVILSGGSIGATPDRNMNNSLNDQSFLRTYMGYKIWKKKNVPVIVTGGKLFDAMEPEALTMSNLLLELGVSKNMIIIEDKSRNTIENALNINDIIKNKNFKKIALITSAYHMKRSVYIFKKININVIPFPTDYRNSFKKNSFISFLPSISNLYDIYLTFHEYIGIIFAKIKLAGYK